MKVLSVLLMMTLPTVVADRRPITILHHDTEHPNQYALMPHLSPIIFVRQVAGPELEDKRDVSCHWSQQIDSKTGLPNVVGDCDENVRLVIVGIDLNY